MSVDEIIAALQRFEEEAADQIRVIQDLGGQVEGEASTLANILEGNQAVREQVQSSLAAVGEAMDASQRHLLQAIESAAEYRGRLQS